MVILVFGINYTSYRKPRDIILTEMNTLSKDLKIGSSSHFLIKEGFVNYSYANCTQFVLLLKEALSNHGIISRKVGVISSSGGAHNLLEVRLGKRWVLADAMSNVLYDDSLLDILMDPELARYKSNLYNLNDDLKVLTDPELFAQAVAVDFGDMYFSDKLRWVPLSAKQKYDVQSFDLICPASQCKWALKISEEILADSLFKSLPMMSVISEGTKVRISDQNNTLFTSNLPQILHPINNELHFKSNADGPHKLSIYVGVVPADEMESVQMRVPIPSVLVFRRSKIYFYGSSLVCDGSEVWRKSAMEEDSFHNAFFLPSGIGEPAWQKFTNFANKKYYRSKLGLPGNEARIRIQPHIGGNKPTSCEISFNYMAESPVEVLLYTQADKNLFEIEVLPKCQGSVCNHKIILKEEVIASLFHN